MASRSPRGRRALAAVVCAGLVVGVAATTTPALAAPADPAEVPKPTEELLGSHDLELLAAAESAGEDRVTLLIAAEEDSTAAVAEAVDDLGGTVANQVAEVGYLRVAVPTAAVRKAAALPGIAAVDVDEVLQQPDPRPESLAGVASARQGATLPAPGAATPAVNPYLPTSEIGAPQFVAAHPEWDGREVTIGVLDSGVDLDHPALQTTTTGERKIVDWVTATDPVFDGDLTWRRMDTAVTGPAFTIAGAAWTAPAGEFRFNLFRESITAASEPAGDVNRDGDTTDEWGVLYRPADNAIWLDVDQDRSFTDEDLMRPYNVGFQVGHLGTDDPATDVVESTPFVVQFREDVDLSPYGGAFVGQRADFVNIGLVQDAHGSHVAGIAAGHALFGGAMDGAAPGAKVVSSRACTWSGGCTAAALTDGMVDLVVNRGVDVVNMSIGGLPALNDANNARSRLYDRLVADYGVQLFLSAGNSGPGLNTVGDPSVATDVVSVGASISKETWLANYGSVVRTAQGMFNFSSRGPREDGGAKPNLSAPGSAISTTPRWLAQPPVAEAGYALPVGYAMFNGTSMASPMAAGGAALLVSAAFATDTDVTPAQLRRALSSGTRFLRDVPAYAQGSGLMDVGRTWQLLHSGVQARTYVVDAPVCTPISDFLATPDRGTGVYNRCASTAGGHAPGQPKTYEVTITRTSGPAGRLVHDLSWLGNDGTWAAPTRVNLPLNTPRTITLRARPTEGAHGAILRIDDPATRVVDAQAMNVVVATPPSQAPGFGGAWSGRVDRNASRSYFVDVPAGTAALQVNLSQIATGSQTRFIAINPYGVPVESTSSLVCYTSFSPAATCNPVSRAYANPLPGVWEIEVESRRTSPVLSNPFSLRAQVQTVSVEPTTLVLPTVAAGAPTPVSWTVTNEQAPVTVTGRGGALGSAVVERPTIDDGDVQTYEVVVPAGAATLEVAIGGTSDLGADLDLYVLRGGTEVGSSADGDSEESVTLPNPAPGTYTVEVDAYSVPAGSTEYDYRDVFFASALGELSLPATTLTLATGQAAQINGSVVALQAPAAGRQLFGRMQVVTSEGAVVGTGSVLVGAVTGG